MRAPEGVLDTSTLLLAADIDASDLPVGPFITAVTLTELSVGPLVANDAKTRSDRQRQLQEAEAMFSPLPFDAAAARCFGAVSASLRGRGPKTSARAFDALIAATAIANDLPVFTCNATDFDGIDGLTVVAVPHPDRP